VLYAGWKIELPLLIENMMMKLRTEVDNYSTAGTEAGI
jgi:hypothetical protein